MELLISFFKGSQSPLELLGKGYILLAIGKRFLHTFQIVLGRLQLLLQLDVLLMEFCSPAIPCLRIRPIPLQLRPKRSRKSLLILDNHRKRLKIPLQSLYGDIAVVDLLLLILDLALQLFDQLEGVARGFLLLILIHEVVVFLFPQVLLRLNHRKA